MWRTMDFQFIFKIGGIIISTYYIEIYKNYEAAIRVKEALITMAKELNAFDKEWYKDAIYDINEIISYFYRGQIFFIGGGQVLF